MRISIELQDLRKYIIYDEKVNGVHHVYLRCMAGKEGVLEVLKRIKSPYRLEIHPPHTYDLTMERLGFKMITRECSGNLYIKEG